MEGTMYRAGTQHGGILRIAPLMVDHNTPSPPVFCKCGF